MTFFDKYSYKQKNFALIVVTILLIAAAYKRVFRTTIETVGYSKELHDKIAQSHNADLKIRNQYKEIALLNKIIGKENVSIERAQQGFLNFFAEHAKGLTVYSIDEVLVYQHPDYKINTHRIVLKGGYINTLEFIYCLEKEFSLGKVLNLSFEYRKASIEDQKDLYTTILLQNYLR